MTSQNKTHKFSKEQKTIIVLLLIIATMVGIAVGALTIKSTPTSSKENVGKEEPQGLIIRQLTEEEQEKRQKEWEEANKTQDDSIFTFKDGKWQIIQNPEKKKK
jgi:hypothetical protein